MTLREHQGHPEHGRGVKAVYALYPDGHSAQQALSQLHAAGVHDRDITIQSVRNLTLRAGKVVHIDADEVKVRVNKTMDVS